jgi:flavin reductase (DIM6/NTAB) family NADH-FMN oxidoreductase RutF
MSEITAPTLPALRENFRTAFRRHPAGVAAITADSGLGPVLLTATSVASVSAEPPLLMFSLSRSSSSTPTVRRSETVVVHLLDASQLEIAHLGATSGIDRFANGDLWATLPTGETYLPTAATWIRARTLSAVDAGGSVVMLAEALEIVATEEVLNPLVYHDRMWHTLDESSVIK